MDSHSEDVCSYVSIHQNIPMVEKASKKSKIQQSHMVIQSLWTPQFLQRVVKRGMGAMIASIEAEHHFIEADMLHLLLRTQDASNKDQHWTLDVKERKPAMDDTKSLIMGQCCWFFITFYLFCVVYTSYISIPFIFSFLRIHPLLL